MAAYGMALSAPDMRPSSPSARSGLGQLPAPAGWPVPGAELDLYPERIGRQARMIAYAPKMMAVLQALVDQTKSEPENVPDDIAALVQEAKAIARYIEQDAPQ